MKRRSVLTNPKAAADILPAWIAKRREIASIYEKGFSGLAQVKTPPPPIKGRYFDVFIDYVIRAQHRDKLVTHLTERGIEVLISWLKSMHKQKGLRLANFRLLETERISRKVVLLPNDPKISDEQGGIHHKIRA